MPLPTYDPLFSSKDAKAALEHVIAMHFLRTGRFSTAEIFIRVRLRFGRVVVTDTRLNSGLRKQEFDVDLPAGRQAQFVDLYRILVALRNQDINPALEYVLPL